MTAREWPLAAVGDKCRITTGLHAGKTATVTQVGIIDPMAVWVTTDTYYTGNANVARLRRSSIRIHGVDIDLTPAQRRVMADWAKTGYHPHANMRTLRALGELGLTRFGRYGAELTEAGKTWCRRNFPDGKVK